MDTQQRKRLNQCAVPLWHETGQHPFRMKLYTLLLGLSLLPFAANATSPRLTNLLPTGGQRGTEVEVRFTGQRLDDAQEIIFYQPGITARKLDSVKTNSVRTTLQIASDCRFGEHQMRLRTATGVSELRTFWVGPFASTNEVEPNSEFAKPQAVPLNSTVLGTILADDVDCFRVSATAGQRLTAEVEAMRLGRGAFDAHVAILDADGKVLAAAEDSTLAMQDAIVSIIAPKTGDYIVQVRESSFGGKEDYHYRLHIGNFPRPVVVYPVAGRAGEKVNVKFLGDVKGDFAQEFKLPTTAQEKFALFAEQGGFSAPSPNWLRVTPLPCVLEAEPNDTRETAASAPEAPVVFNGIIGKASDHDWFRFRTKKGANLQINVFARRLRSPLDSAIQIVNAKGASVAENDDAAGPDSALTFKPEEDGEYTVLVRDHLKRGGADFVYALEIAPVEPSLSVKIPEVARNDTQSRQTITVPRGNRFATLASVKRANFSGDVAFRISGLPTGVKLLADPLAAKTDAAPLVFEAAADAPIGGKLLDLVVVSTNRLEGHFRNDIDLVPAGNNTFYYGTRVEKLYVAVIEAAPFKLRLVEPKVPLVQGGTMEMQVEVERAAGFDEPVSLKMVWSPPGVTAQSDVTIPKGKGSVAFPLNAKADAEVRSWKIAVLGSATVSSGPLFVSTQLAKFDVAEPFLTAVIEKSACEPGRSTNILVKLDQKIPFTGKATVKLLGLPEKATTPDVQITSADKEVIFKVTVDPKCPTGSHKNLFCSVAIKKDGEVIPHSLGAGGILRIVPPKKPVVAAEVPKKVAKN